MLRFLDSRQTFERRKTVRREVITKRGLRGRESLAQDKDVRLLSPLDSQFFLFLLSLRFCFRCKWDSRRETSKEEVRKAKSWRVDIPVVTFFETSSVTIIFIWDSINIICLSFTPHLSWIISHMLFVFPFCLEKKRRSRSRWDMKTSTENQETKVMPTFFWPPTSFVIFMNPLHLQLKTLFILVLSSSTGCLHHNVEVSSLFPHGKLRWFRRLC